MYAHRRVQNQMNENLPFYDLYLEDYIRRMVYAKENDANIMMITGDIEPLQNRHFLQTLAILNRYVLPQKDVQHLTGLNYKPPGSCLIDHTPGFAQYSGC